MTTNPNTGWVGRNQPGGDLPKTRADVAERLARVLGVPVEEIVVVDVPELSGTQLTAHWCPS